MNFEETILRNLLNNNSYREQVFPFLEPEYFEEITEKMLFGEIKTFITKYNAPPSREALALIVQERGDLLEAAYEDAIEKVKIVTTSNSKTEQNLQWLIDETESYCQHRAISNAISDSIEIMNGEETKQQKSSIPQLLKDALSVNFQVTLGHMYKENAEERYMSYIDKKTHIPCDLHMINQITEGGVWKKSLNLALADTGIGKSIFLCHLAASYMARGLNVTYFTMEMSEYQLAKRVDANLMDIRMDDLDENLSKSVFDAKMSRIKNDYTGDICIKEFPSGGAHAGHFRQMLDESELKDGFKTDVIIVDYLEICSSERWKPGTIRHDLYLKSIAEELRNLGKEYDVPVWSAHQSNRDGAETMDVGKKNTGNSYGILQTVDLMFVLIADDDLQARNQILIKQLKNRYQPDDRPRTFLMGLDKSKMRFYNTDAQVEEAVERNKSTSKVRLEAARKQQTEDAARTTGLVFNV